MKAQTLYQQIEMETVPKLTLVIMCYKRIIELLQDAIDYIKKGKYDKKSEALSKAISIITELISALDFEKGKQIAYALNNIYLYCLNTIMEADTKNRADLLEGLIPILEEIKDAWEQISREGVKK